jgi:excinuclease ABC subunit B
VQTIGRAARNEHGEVYMYADTITDSMRFAIDETNRRRAIQEAYNAEHGIVPRTVRKNVEDAIRGKETREMAARYMNKKKKMSAKDHAKLIGELEAEMREAAASLNFERAAELRDMIFELKSED